MKFEPNLKVFVYGTLKPGEANFTAYCSGYVKSQEEAYVKGLLYALPVGYPAVTEGNNKVRGVLLTFNLNTDFVLQNLDLLEGYQPNRALDLNEYNRRLVAVYDLDDQIIDRAWCYFMTREKIKQYQGILIKTNFWTGL